MATNTNQDRGNKMSTTAEIAYAAYVEARNAADAASAAVVYAHAGMNAARAAGMNTTATTAAYVEARTAVRLANAYAAEAHQASSTAWDAYQFAARTATIRAAARDAAYDATKVNAIEHLENGRIVAS